MTSTAYDDQFAPDPGTRPPGRQPTYPWCTMSVGDAIAYPVASEREMRNIRRNVSQNGMRNDKAFRARFDRSTMTMHVVRIR